jgi:hypothetical protein
MEDLSDGDITNKDIPSKRDSPFKLQIDMKKIAEESETSQNKTEIVVKSEQGPDPEDEQRAIYSQRWLTDHKLDEELRMRRESKSQRYHISGDIPRSKPSKAFEQDVDEHKKMFEKSQDKLKTKLRYFFGKSKTANLEKIQ